MNRSLMISLLLLATAFAAFSARLLGAASHAREQARDDLKECVELVQQIERFDRQPRLVAKAADIVDATYAVAEGLRFREFITSVNPTDPAPFGQSGYTMQQAVVIAERCSLGQIVDFTHDLETTNRSIRVSSLTLDATTGSDESSGELWVARITLTQFVSIPITPDVRSH